MTTQQHDSGALSHGGSEDYAQFRIPNAVARGRGCDDTLLSTHFCLNFTIQWYQGAESLQSSFWYKRCELCMSFLSRTLNTSSRPGLVVASGKRQLWFASWPPLRTLRKDLRPRSFGPQFGRKHPMVSRNSSQSIFFLEAAYTSSSLGRNNQAHD